MKIDRRTPSECIPWINVRLEHDTGLTIDIDYAQCFHMYVDNRIHIYICSNILTEEIISAEFESERAADFALVVDALKLADSTTKLVFMDTLSGDVRVA